MTIGVLVAIKEERRHHPRDFFWLVGAIFQRVHPERGDACPLFLLVPRANDGVGQERERLV